MSKNIWPYIKKPAIVHIKIQLRVIRRSQQFQKILVYLKPHRTWQKIIVIWAPAVCVPCCLDAVYKRKSIKENFLGDTHERPEFLLVFSFSWSLSKQLDPGHTLWNWRYYPWFTGESDWGLEELNQSTAFGYQVVTQECEPGSVSKGPHAFTMASGRLPTPHTPHP